MPKSSFCHGKTLLTRNLLWDVGLSRFRNRWLLSHHFGRFALKSYSVLCNFDKVNASLSYMSPFLCLKCDFIARELKFFTNKTVLCFRFYVNINCCLMWKQVYVYGRILEKKIQLRISENTCLLKICFVLQISRKHKLCSYVKNLHFHIKYENAD